MPEHKDLTDPNLHEPKGLAALTGGSSDTGKVYVSDGAGGGSWRSIPHGAFYYDDIGTGTVFTTPTSYTLVDPDTVGDNIPREFTHNDLGRLTYTGITSIDANCYVSITLKHSSASLVDTFFQLHKNGAPITGAQHVTSALSGNYTHVTLSAHVDLATNDYVEVYTKTATGNVVVHAMTMNIQGQL